MTHPSLWLTGVLSFLSLSCADAPPEPVRSAHYGTMREALRDGKTEGRVALDALELGPATYAVGALAGLAGEITIDGGEVWISTYDPATGLRTSQDERTGQQATMLFLAEAAGSWSAHTVAEDVAADAVDDFIGGLVEAAGHAPDAVVPIVVEGPLETLRMHVIAGGCPIRARMLGQELAQPPFVFETAETSGRLIGIFARQAGGTITHMGSDTHLHVRIAIDGEPATGHVEVVGLGAGAVVRLPD